ncbi:MAG: TonB-dependent receptor [Chryseolinea sp.]
MNVFTKRRIVDLKCILVALLLGAQFSAYAQDAQSFYASRSQQKDLKRAHDGNAITLRLDSAILEQILVEIEGKTSYTFIYTNDQVFKRNKVSVNVVNARVEQVLAQILDPLRIDYVVKGKKIVLNTAAVKKGNEATGEQTLVQPNGSRSKSIIVAFKVTVSGIVKDELNQPLPGVNILEKGTTNGTATNGDGTYTISVQDESSVLVFSFIGFSSKEIQVGQQTAIDISMEPDTQTFDEVVIVGYGEQKRSDITGAVASVKARDIQNLPVRSLAEALQGRVAGLVVTQDDGSPRGGSDVIMRGPVNINGRGPLYVVDGIPFIGTGPAFNIQDVESIEVLKDASAAAIYGTLASGGVILVTTKKGQAGQMKASAFANYGVREVFNLPKFLQRDDYIKAKTAFGFDAQSLFGDPAQYSTLPDTDWLDEIYDTGKEQNYTLSLSGGSEKSKFYSSVNYNRIDGTKMQSWNERFALRLNSDHVLNKRLKIGQTLYASTMKEDPSSSTPIPMRSTPLMNVYDPTNVNGGWGMSPPGFNGTNPIGEESNQYRRNLNYEVNIGAYWELEIIKDLKFRNNLAFGQYGQEDNYYNYPYSFGIVSDFNENFGKYMMRNRNYLANFVLSYNKTISDHAFGGMIGYEARKVEGTDLRGNARKPIVPNPQSFGLVTSDIDSRPSGGSWEGDRYLSLFGRVTYSYKDRYLLTANIRRDGSALKFGPNNKFGTFPSIALGWKISEEDFMANSSFSALKLRASYGVLGNEPGDNYIFSTGYVLGGNTAYAYDFGNNVRQIGITGEPRLANPDIKWESVATTNIGIDAGLFSNRLTFSLDLYTRQTRDMIYRVYLPQSAGIGAEVQQNVGEMNNKGIELMVDYRNQVGAFTYGVTLTGSYNQNKLVTLIPELNDVQLRDGDSNQAYGDVKVSKSEPGEPLGQFYGYIVDGIYANDDGREARPVIAASGTYKPQAGDLMYRDINSDGKINEDDKTYIGNPWPKLNYGLNVTLGYKSFDLSMFFNGVQGVDIYNSTTAYTATFYGDHNTTNAINEASLFNGNGITGAPRVGTATDSDKNFNYNSVSSYHVENGSFFKLKNLQVGYKLPQSAMSKVGIGSARIFFMSNNLLTLTKYSGIDPEIAGGVRARGIDNNLILKDGQLVGRYPRSRLFSLGLNIEF